MGSLQYLAIKIRPDITFKVNKCARFITNPDKLHWDALNKIWQYLINTVNIGVVYQSDPNIIKLTGFSDLDWGGDYPTRYSTSGYLFTINNSPITWFSKL